MFSFVTIENRHKKKKKEKLSLIGRCCLLLALLLAEQARADDELLLDIGKAIELLVRYGVTPNSPERPEPLSFLLQDLIPATFHLRPANENGTRSEFMQYNLEDRSNDEARHLSLQQLIERSGFEYELHDAVADDGYITQLTRLINPLVDAEKLRQPPVLLEHGATIDPTAYLLASSIQHHPERWPRTADDGPITSWNRSLAFVLANHGFDVWLAETRGSNDRNRRHLKTEALRSVLSEDKNASKNMSKAENIHELLRSWDYWAFSQDDIIEHELKSHVDTVLQVTQAQRVHLMSYSVSTATSLAFLSSRSDYAGNKIQGYVCMAPIISGHGASRFTKLTLEGICNLLPNQVGHMLFNGGLLSMPMRQFYLVAFRSRRLRYSLGKAIINLLMGTSAKWQTLLDDNVLGHLFRTVSYRELKQMCQHIRSNRFAHFDYGPAKNLLLYKQPLAPLYDLSQLNITDWLVVSAANDEIATTQVYEHLYALVNPKPVAHVVAPAFNHLDLIAGWGNDKYVNLPILKYLERMSSPGSLDDDALMKKAVGRAGGGGGGLSGSARGLSNQLARTIDLKAMFEQLQAMSLPLAEAANTGNSSTKKPLVSGHLPLLGKSQQVMDDLVKNLVELVDLEKQSDEQQTDEEKQKEIKTTGDMSAPEAMIQMPIKGLLRAANTPAKLLKQLNLADLLNRSLGQLAGPQVVSRADQDESNY